MITKNQIKYIHALGLKKYRDEYKCFIAEGPKVVADLLPLLPCKTLFATPEFRHGLQSHVLENVEEIIEITPAELERLSLLRSPREALAVFHQPEYDKNTDSLVRLAENQLCLALDGVQDPGNLGTIIRIADWYGIEHIFVSKDTVDVYSPKVIQATMGAVGRVHLHYLDLVSFLRQAAPSTDLWGTFLNGDNIYTYPKELTNKGILIMGNEGNGISPEVEKLIQNRLFIPNFPTGRSTSESLNVAVATAIICSEFRRHCF